MYELFFLILGFALSFLFIKFKNKNLLNKNISEKNLESKDLFKNQKKILNQIPDQILVIDKLKNIVFANQSALNRFGGNIKDSHIAEVIRTSKFLDGIDFVIEKNIPTAVKTEIQTPTYQAYEANIFQAPIFENERSIIILLRDLTEIYKIQQIKSDFVANVSHQLRTPLQSIKMGLETIDDKDSQKKFLPIMLQEAYRMENLIKDLLILSKIEQQEHIKPKDIINLNEIIYYVKSSNKESLDKKNITLDIDIPEDATNVIGDKDKLIEVFSNLVDNSIKYSEPQKKIHVETYKKNSHQIEIVFKDQGIGIPKDLLPRVSERFFQADPKKSRVVGGTGLGLAIAKHIIIQHRGNLRIESEEGIGSKFIINLPLAS